jgi:ribonucleoside-diphosphate reductase alpha chain
MNAQIQIYDGITTNEIHQVVIQSAANLISEKTPNYQHVAANLLNYYIRKNIFGVQSNLPRLLDVIKINVEKGVYDAKVLEDYTEEEINKVNSFIRHERDYKFTYAGLQQVIDKYLLKDRKSDTLFETPQFMYAMIALTLFADYDKSDRISRIKSYYNDISKWKISLPTPIMAGVRTPNRQYSSCTLIDVGDSLDSLVASNGAVIMYTAKRAGIGLNFGRIRALGDSIRGGEVVHTGVIPYLKWFEKATKSCTQNGIRGGSSTTHFPWWHKEIMDILVLKNNRGTDDNRVRQMDYSIQFNRLMYRRFVKDQEISLFSPNDVPDLYEAFFRTNDEFEKIYEKYENDDSIEKIKIPAKELMAKFAKERIETGRMYVMNIDHVNAHSSFTDPVHMSNLCVAPETKILTENGYEKISDLENQVVSVWNGENYTDTVVKKTGENQKLIEININDYESIECTPYHRFFVAENYNSMRRNKIVEKRAHELKIGDKLIKFNLPLINGFEKFEHAYAKGLHTADGSSYKNKNIDFIDLYEHKREVVDSLPTKTVSVYENKTRVVLDIDNLNKFEVPTAKHTIESRLEWFAGYIDGDGGFSANGSNTSLQFKSTNLDFFKDVRLMLHSLGVDSKITKNKEAGEYLMPDGKGGKKLFNCKKTYRLLVSSSALYKLFELGLNEYLINRKLDGLNKPNRNAEKYHVVTGIVDNGRTDDTYCFTESERGMGMFNGFLAGNCQEITLPTTPISSLADGDDEEGEIALCTLSGINLGEIKNFDDLESICENVIRGLDSVITHQDYPVKAAKKMLKRRSLGVGVTNFAYWLAKNGFTYEDPEALPLVDEMFEHIQYYLLKASNKLAQEQGACEWFDRTKYSKGILPIDTYEKNVDSLFRRKYTCDWEGLRADILEHGLRNSTLTAIMPVESSSVVSNSTNGIEPVRSLITTKKSKQKLLRLVVPEFSKLKNKYQLAFDMESNRGYTNIQAVITKWIDQAISGNHYYDFSKSEDKSISISDVIKDLLYSYKMGLKTLYYANSNDEKTDDFSKQIEQALGQSNGQKEEEIQEVAMVDDAGCEGGACTL